MKRNRYISFTEQVDIEIPVSDLLGDITDSELLEEIQHRKLLNMKSKYWNSVDYQTKMELFESMIDKFTYDELKQRLTK